jgi:hypothetical protein
LPAGLNKDDGRAEYLRQRSFAKEYHSTVVNYEFSIKLCGVVFTHNRMVKKIYKWKPITTRLQGRPKSRWDDNDK